MFLRVSLAVHLVLPLLLLGIRPLSVALLLGYGLYHGFLAWGVLHPRSRLFGPNVSRLATNERVVALTFDDGPHPVVTPLVLEILRQRGVRATFFLIGRWAERHPEIVRQIVAEGHGVGNHSHEHSYGFWALPPRRLAEDLERAQKAIQAACGITCRWFRAPVGLKSVFLRRVLDRQGLDLVSWNVRFLGHRRPQELSKRLARRIVPGSILLLHDGHDRKSAGRPNVLEELPALLSALDALGYRCVALGNGDRSNSANSQN